MNELVSYSDRGLLQAQMNSGNQLNSSCYGCIDPLPLWPQQQHYHYHSSCTCLSCRPLQPHDTELIIELLGKEIKLNYGARLRVLMADPLKGHDLRYALAKVQEALTATFGA